MKKLTVFIFHFPRNTMSLCILLYQKFLSPDHSFWAKWMYPDGYCRFYPSCSTYGMRSIQKYGVVKGGGKTIYRILRCNPWNDGGVDMP